eukprot:CAMPEP_0172540650 /NCGR_PEP_ID=MMETSP1067-20121228/11620_1 /TAXON_ID=265564 ORGANISM="Thalassiosira punctigera, Strain Tpunct2005C2" /NCGR_SAMPLE_ID=MMETSP1067 /ASSEMBLY_ACC=CAM_ASM_000444 /LENGTH=236 /DNA_ID=CAMNT_0013326551 /DNA_START=20 /DNA_END=726 /DNA_ORIENTATION=-
MDISDARRQVAEINALQVQPKYANAIEITTPALFDRLEKAIAANGGGGGDDRTLPVRKCLSLEISCRELDIDELSGWILAVDLPSDYPSRSTCRVRAVRDGETVGDAGAKIAAYLQSFLGCECLELILDWLYDNKSACLSSGGSDASDDAAGGVECYVLRYNHLLLGPEHKKEKAMVDAAKKSKLQGGLLWGTPGIIVVVPPSTEEDAREYATASKDIGKRPDGVEAARMPESGLV